MKVYTDGSCLGNPGPGGWAFIVVVDDAEVTRGYGSEKDTTNNRMELQAIIEALEWLEAGKPAVIYSDSAVSVNVVTGVWQGRKNLDLVEKARSLLAKRDVGVFWIAGHNGAEWNELADFVARQGAAKLR